MSSRRARAAVRLLGAVFQAAAAAGHAQDSPPAEATPLTWVFLNSGAARTNLKSMSAEAVGKMQAEHVGNFGRQFDRGTLMAAGPLGDNGFIRGIVVLVVPGADQVAHCFKPDPYVQNDILAVEAHPWLADVTRFGTPKVPFQMAQHTLCVVSKGPTWATGEADHRADALLRLLPGLRPEARSGELALAGPLTDAGEKLGLLRFYSTNAAQLQARLAQEPAVAEGRVQLSFHPQFLGQGTLHDPRERREPPAPGRRAPLFDGRSIAGWEGDTNGTWKVVGGALVGGSLSATVPRNDLLCTIREFGDFDLRLKVKFEGTGLVNAGIQFRSQRLTDPAFEMIGYQADMGEGYWGCLYDESRRNKVLARTHALLVKRLVRHEEWNDYIIRCEGPRVRLWLNGVLTVDYTETDQEIPRRGRIGLQIHGGGKALASYKDITIEEL